MEKRLIPVNTLIALATPSGFERPVLAEAGYYVAALETSALTPHGTVTIDVVIASNGNSHLLACESKSGNNVEVDQAERYAALDGSTLVQAALITLRDRSEPHTEVLYACLEEHSERILLGLRSLDLPFPVLAIAEDKITLKNVDHASDPLRVAFSTPIKLEKPPPRFIPFDHESPKEVIEPRVRAELIASLAKRLPQISFGTLTEQVMPYYVLYSRVVQTQIRKKVGQVAREIAQSAPETFEYHAPSPNRDGWVRFLRTPEDNDPRGRTQAYQAFARRGRAGRPARSKGPGEGQLELDLLKLLDTRDDVGSTQDPAEEGRATRP